MIRAPVEVQVSLGDEGDLINKIDRTPLKVLLESVKTFTFVLCRKEARLGKLRFPQFWMEPPRFTERASVPLETGRQSWILHGGTACKRWLFLTMDI